jgi:hypothetical protein
MPQPDIFKTSDFQSVVFLLCNDAELSSAYREGPRTVMFEFRGKGYCEVIMANMMFHDQVSLARALQEIRKARTVIHNTD